MMKIDRHLPEAPLSPIRQARLMLVVIAPMAACYPAIKLGLDFAPSLRFGASRTLVGGLALLVVLVIPTLGPNIASEEIHSVQARKYIFQLVPFSARGPPIVHGSFVLQIASTPISARGVGDCADAMQPTFQTRC